jgi:adenylate cyclase
MARPIRAYSLFVGRHSARPMGEALPGNEGRPSIVVLPFREHQSQPGEEYFAEGIVDDIVHALSGLKELFVIARGSTLGYVGPTVDVRAIGRELDVRYVMMGSVQRANGKIRIRTELCNADSGAIAYADQYDGDLGDLFELQRQITTRLVTTLAPQVREHERLRAMRKHPQNMTAYDYVLQALRSHPYRPFGNPFARVLTRLAKTLVAETLVAARGPPTIVHSRGRRRGLEGVRLPADP